MEEVGNDLSAGAEELVLESAPQMAQEVAAEEELVATEGNSQQSAVDSENAGVGVADGVGTGETPFSSLSSTPFDDSFSLPNSLCLSVIL